MEARVVSHPLDGIPQLVRRPVLEVAAWVRRVQEVTERLKSQMREVATVVLRVLDGVALQATRVRTRSQVELGFGSLTVSIISGVSYARPDAGAADLC